MAALAASFQPAKAATRTGERSSRRLPIPVQCLHASERTARPAPAPRRSRPRAGSRSAHGGGARPDPPRGGRVAPRTAVRGSLRVPVQGAPDVAHRLGLPLAAAARSHRRDRRRASFRERRPHRPALRGRRRDRRPRPRRALPRRARGGGRRRAPAGAGQLRPRRLPARPPTARSTSWRASSSTSTREIADPALRGGGGGGRLRGAAGRRIPPRALHARVAITRTSAACSSTRSRSRRSSARPASCIRASTRTC